MKLYGLRLRFGICTMATVLPSFLSPPRSFGAADLSHALTQAYKGKDYMIRNFWEGGTLSYDAAGQRIGDADLGNWTTDGIVRIEKIEVTPNHVLHVECRRMVVNVKSDAFDYTAIRGERSDRREIDIDLGQQEATSSFVESVFSQIFVADPNSFLDAVPKYWKACIKTAVTGSGDKPSPCRFGPHFSGLFSASAANMPPAKAVSASPSTPPVIQSEPAELKESVVKIGNGVLPPKAVYDPEPSFSQIASQVGEQGTCILTLIVDASGSVKDIQIAKPLGYGLDEQAVSTVGTWKFEPGRKNGQPVSVYASVEIVFHMR